MYSSKYPYKIDAVVDFLHMKELRPTGDGLLAKVTAPPRQSWELNPGSVDLEPTA